MLQQAPPAQASPPSAPAPAEAWAGKRGHQRCPTRLPRLTKVPGLAGVVVAAWRRLHVAVDPAKLGWGGGAKGRGSAGRPPAAARRLTVSLSLARL